MRDCIENNSKEFKIPEISGKTLKTSTTELLLGMLKINKEERLDWDDILKKILKDQATKPI